MIDYNKLLSSARRRISSVNTGRTILMESESDRGRVLFSPAFRRLQQKAQVFSMEPNAAVRSRLTHSLEVSQIGRYLADEITQRLGTRLDQLQQGALVNFVETEPPRVLRRLFSLRGLSHEQEVEPVFT